MAQDWEKLHGIFYGNINPAMQGWLGEQLGVSSKSLCDLQIGWVPVVTFKKEKKGYGFFTVPMRDAAGRIIGLSLRSREGTKLMYPGSQPGCVYHVNPEHQRGEHGYSAGAHNWVRASGDALCPVCHKPDGCLIASDNAKAAICRVHPSERPMKFGWLHILRPEGDMDSALLPGVGLVLVVEGMSDVAAAADMGFAAVGRPSNTGGQEIAGEVVRGRSVVVVGENDAKADGKWPGRDGMVATHAFLRKRTHKVRMLMPPATVKDLRAWKVVNGLDAAGFEHYAEEHAVEVASKLVLSDSRPVTIADAFLRDTYYANRRFTLRRWNDAWYEYQDGEGKYAVLKDPVIRAAFYAWSRDKQCEKETPKGATIEPLTANTSAWSNFLQAGESSVILDVPAIPAWINGAKGPDPKSLIVFNNGILDVSAFLRGETNHLDKTTPDFFNTTALPIPFNPAAVCPEWDAFLLATLGDDADKILLLQEWFGYCMTPDVSHQKLMYFRGESGSGKGTILHVLESLVGKAQAVSTSFSDLAQSFGLSPLVGKLVCMLPDARRPESADAMRGLEVLLQISGADAVQINRKFKDQIDGQILTARITIASNDFIDVPDHNGALKRRLNVIQFPVTFRDNPDLGLKEKLQAEVEGIAIWALAGLKRLRDRGEFTRPPSSETALADWERDTNPMRSFVQDCLVPAADTLTMKDALFDCWNAWAREGKRSTWTRTVFMRRFAANTGYAKDVGTAYRGIDITTSAAQRYLRRP